MGKTIIKVKYINSGCLPSELNYILDVDVENMSFADVSGLPKKIGNLIAKFFRNCGDDFTDEEVLRYIQEVGKIKATYIEGDKIYNVIVKDIDNKISIN